MSEQNRSFVSSSVPWAAVSYLRKPTPWLGQTFIYFVIIFIFAVLVYSANTMVTVSVDAVGRLNSEVAPVPVKSSAQFTVGKINVKENQKVKKNEVLFVSNQIMSNEDLDILKQYISKLQNVMKENLVTCLTCKNQLRESSVLYTRIKVQGQQLQSSLTPLQNQSVELASALEEYEGIPLLTADIKQSIKTAQNKINEIKKRKAESLLATEMESLKQEVLVNQTRVNDRYQRSYQRIKTAKENISARLTELNNMIEYLGQVQVVNAPFDGVVTKLSVKGEGEFLQAGQVLLELVPVEAKLIAELDLQNKDISKVKEGEKVKITVDALPDYEYGSLDAEVLEVVRKAAGEAPSQPSAPGQAPATFLVKVKLAQQFLSKNGNSSPLILGMTVKGHVVVTQESLLNSIYRMIFKIKEEAKVL